MTSIVIAGYARSPFHFAKKGGLINLRPDDLAAQVLKGLVNKLDLDPSQLEDVIMGCAYPEAEQGMNIARIASFRAGFPETLGGATVNRFCGSSMTSVHFAAGADHAWRWRGLPLRRRGIHDPRAHGRLQYLPQPQPDEQLPAGLHGHGAYRRGSSQALRHRP